MQAVIFGIETVLLIKDRLYMPEQSLRAIFESRECKKRPCCKIKLVLEKHLNLWIIDNNACLILLLPSSTALILMEQNASI